MTMQVAIKTVLSKYATFSGRARRSEYWYFLLFQVIVYIIAAALDSAIFGRRGLFSAIVVLALLLPSLAVGARRLHDTDRSGWWLLIGFVPFVGGIALLIFFCLKGTLGTNRFGEDPTVVTSLAPAT